MNQFYPLKIREIRPETREAVSLAFEVPPELENRFRFTQGQHLIVRTHLDNEEVRRSYSICAGTHDGELRVAIKKVAGGLFSNWAHTRLKPGHILEVMPPTGHFFTELDPERHGRYLAVAAGSGITPIISIIKTTLETEPNSQFTLIYANRASSSTMFREQLGDMKNKYLERLNLIFIFSREQQDVDLYNGHINAEKCSELFTRWLDVKHLNAAFICGPQVMTQTVRERLTGAGMAVDKIHFELFAATLNTRRRQVSDTSQSDAAQELPRSQITVIHDGRAVAFELAKNTQSILDAGNAQGLDLPYSCKAGVCSTCRCKVIEGEVEMDNNFALEDYEVAAGYILSCQSFPLSEKLVLDYDQP